MIQLDWLFDFCETNYFWIGLTPLWDVLTVQSIVIGINSIADSFTIWRKISKVRITTTITTITTEAIHWIFYKGCWDIDDSQYSKPTLTPVSKCTPGYRLTETRVSASCKVNSSLRIQNRTCRTRRLLLQNRSDHPDAKGLRNNHIKTTRRKVRIRTKISKTSTFIEGLPM